MADNTIPIPSGSITEAALKSTFRLPAAKGIHHFGKEHRQLGGADVAAKTDLIHIASYAGSVVAFKVVTITAPTGGDKAFTVDLKKSTGGGAVATILSAVVTVNSTSTSLVVQSGTISSADYVAGDIFEVVVAVSGSTGSQGQGVIAEAFFDEYAA